MPDVNGFPDTQDVLLKLQVTRPDTITADMGADFAGILFSVIEMFQSPPVRSGEGGGTGRRFAPVTETRRYDGSGTTELIIDDVLPTAPVTVSAWGSAFSSVSLRTPENPGDGYHTLSLPGSDFGSLGYGYGLYSGFPRGVQNIAVSATFGNAVTKDIWEALRCEVAYRFLVQSYVGLTGVGEEISIGSYSINTSVGAINFKLTSPLTVFHDTYLAAVSRYRRSPQREWTRLASRHQMS